MVKKVIICYFAILLAGLIFIKEGFCQINFSVYDASVTKEEIADIVTGINTANQFYKELGFESYCNVEIILCSEDSYRKALIGYSGRYYIDNPNALDVFQYEGLYLPQRWVIIITHL